MKSLFIAIGLLSCLTSTAAFAQSAQSTTVVQAPTDVSWKAPASTLTRADVRRDLIHAEKDGQLKYLDSTLYRGGR
jgi:hypothetical protein